MPREVQDTDEFCWVLSTPIDAEGDHHVIPFGDLYEHKKSRNCWCQPEDDHEEDDYVFYHNAADNREDYQGGLRKPH